MCHPRCVGYEIGALCLSLSPHWKKSPEPELALAHIDFPLHWFLKCSADPCQAISSLPAHAHHPPHFSSPRFKVPIWWAEQGHHFYYWCHWAKTTACVITNAVSVYIYHTISQQQRPTLHCAQVTGVSSPGCVCLPHENVNEDKCRGTWLSWVSEWHPLRTATRSGQGEGRDEGSEYLWCSWQFWSLLQKSS